MPSLTSFSMVFTTGALVSAALIMLLEFWPALAQPGWRFLAGRIVTLAVFQAGALVFVFILVNYQAGFYSSWADLLGQNTGGGTLSGVIRIQPGASAALVIQSTTLVPAPTGVKLRPHQTIPADGGALDKVVINGALSGLSTAGQVYLPPGYPVPHRAYPVILVLSKSGANPAYGAGQLAADAAQAIVEGKLPPVILVTLPVPAADPGCLNLPGGDQQTLFLTQDVPSALASSYQVAASRNGWGLLSDQADGYCVLQLSLTSAASFSVAALPPGRYQAPQGGYPPQAVAAMRTEEDLFWWFQHYPMQPVSILFTGAGPEPYRRLARTPTVVTQEPLPSGASALTPVLIWLRTHLTAGPAA